MKPFSGGKNSENVFGIAKEILKEFLLQKENDPREKRRDSVRNKKQWK